MCKFLLSLLENFCTGFQDVYAPVPRGVNDIVRLT